MKMSARNLFACPFRDAPRQRQVCIFQDNDEFFPTESADHVEIQIKEKLMRFQTGSFQGL